MKSFILYTDIAEVLRILTDEQKGRLFQSIVDYAETSEVPAIDDIAVKIAFTNIKANIDRNAEKWEHIRQIRSEAGKKGGRPPKVQTEAKQTKEPPQADAQEKPEKEKKQCYGAFKHVRLTPEEYGRLCADFGDVAVGEAITFLDEYIERKGYKAKSHYLCMRKWVFDAVKEEKQKRAKITRIETSGTADDYFREAGLM